DAGPDAGVAVDRPRFFFPRLAARLAGPRHRLERPEQLAGARVERTDEALRVVVRLDRHALFERRADQDDVLHDRRGRVKTRFARVEIDLVALTREHSGLQIDDTGLAERRDDGAVLRVQFDEAVAGRDVDHAVVAAAVGPVRDAAAG